LNTLKVTPSYEQDRCTARDLNLSGFHGFYGPWGKLNHKTVPGVHILGQHIDGTRGYKKVVLWIVRFDNDETTTYIHACLLAKQRYETGNSSC
jgi:hypothetical protein